jgi:hypothetical protein
MYAIGIDDVDFWSEASSAQAKIGRQVPLTTGASSSERDGVGHATIRQSIQWLAPGDVPLAIETREIIAHLNAVPDVSLLTWSFALKPAEGKPTATLWGRHYFGLGVRFVTSMDKGGRFMTCGNRPGELVRGSERLTRANWCAFTAQADGHPVTVAMFDAPTNPRHPATWFSMTTPFAYLSATLNLKEEPWIITPDKPLVARYGVAAWDGTVDAAEIDKVYGKWLSLESARRHAGSH